MGKKKQNGEYNDFLDGEKLRDNGEIRTSLQQPVIATKKISTPSTHQNGRASVSKNHGKGKPGPKKPQLTHFLCLPLVTEASRPQLQHALDKLKEDLSRDTDVPLQAVRPVGTLHLTLGVMSLDDTRLEQAKQCLQSLDLHRLLRDITHRTAAQKAAEDGTVSENLNAAAMPDTDALFVNLEALAPMQAPHKTSVLYAKPVDATGRLGAFAAEVREKFTQEGFLQDPARPLILHATVVDTIYAKSKAAARRGKVKDSPKHVEHKSEPQHHDDSALNDKLDAPPTAEKHSGHSPDANSWLRFDARALIDLYKDLSWAQNVRIDRVQICKMGAKSGGEGEVVDQRYEVVAETRVFE